ncbi:MAG: C45 family peptidase [Candidatus Hydrogenedentota bacterium]
MKKSEANQKFPSLSRKQFSVRLTCVVGVALLLALGSPFLGCTQQESTDVRGGEESAVEQPAPSPETAAPAEEPTAAEEAAAPAEEETRGCPRPAVIGGSGTAEIIGQGEDTMTLVKIEGNRYELGYWYGKLLADQIAETWKLVQAMMEKEEVPMQVLEAAAAQLWQEKNYDVQPWNTEVQGIADGCADAGHPEITFTVLKSVASVPDLSEYNCSLFVAWGAATAGDETYQMRNLDWSMDTGLQDYPVVALYTPEDGVKHAVVGFAGVIGVSVGGMNVEGLGVSEIMGHFCDEETLDGIPFPFLLRDVLYFDRDLESALERMKSATRTNQYHYALADPDADDPKGRLLLTSNTRFDEYADNESVDPHPCKDVKPFHDSLDDVVYWKNHNGRNNEVLYGAIKERYGEIDAQKAIEIARVACVDGTLVSIIYHNSANAMWVAFAEGDTPGPRQEYVQVTLDE